MNVLVTGATGFIGRRLCARLRADGLAVRALVLPDEDARPVGPAEVVRGDVTDPAALTRAVAGCARVYHLAAVVGDWGDPALFERINVGGTRHVLEAAAAAGCARVVMVSSVVVYGGGLRGAVCDEVDTPREWGVGPYSETKRASEELALDFHAFGRVPVAVVRPGNVFGPGSRVWIDDVVRELRAGRVPLIDGGEGDAVLCYVDNVVDVIARAGAAAAAAGRIYNANDGGGVTWRRYLEDLAAIAGADKPRRRLPAGPLLAIAGGLERAWRAAGRPRRPPLTREAIMLLASRAAVPIRRAEADLGYRPAVGYDEAMRRVAAYVHGGEA